MRINVRRLVLSVVVVMACVGAVATFKSFQAGRIAERNERLALDTACELAGKLQAAGLPGTFTSYRPKGKLCEIRITCTRERLSEPKVAKAIADYRDSRQKLRGWVIPPITILPDGVKNAKPYLTIS